MQRSVSIAFQTDKPITAYGPLAKTVEDFGFSGVSVYNDMLYQPAWLPLLEIARHTTRVRLGPQRSTRSPATPSTLPATSPCLTRHHTAAPTWAWRVEPGWTLSAYTPSGR